MDTNLIIGSLLIFLGTLAIILSFLVAIRQYIVPPRSPLKMAIAFPNTDVLKLFLQLLDDILKAPPALAFLVGGIILISFGIWSITTLPF